MSLFNNAIIGASGQQGYQISRSVRLRSSASAYFNRTLTTPTSNTTWSWSGWVKLGQLGTTKQLFGGAGTNYGSFGFETTDQIRFWNNSGTGVASSTAVFRDPSAWYHVVVISNGTTIKAYVNNLEVLSYTGTITNINSAINHQIGRFGGLSYYTDGYLTEINFIDGQALTPSSFGQYNAYGVWTPTKYNGTYGTNGFYLNFSDNSAATAAAIGKDYSGNGNNWTPNNISVTTGSTYDSMLDTPTPYADGGNGRGNYAVMNPLNLPRGGSTSNGNLLYTAPSAEGQAVATMYMSSGKYYWEMVLNTAGSGCAFGIASITTDINNANLTAGSYVYYTNGNKYNGGTGSAYGATFTNGDIIGVALDLDAGTLVFYKNNSSQGTAFTSLSGTFTALIYDGTGAATPTFNANFGQQPFTYTPPTGFKALNTQNLPTPTITNGANYMAATLYTGNAGSITVNNGANNTIGTTFQPDFIWVKARSNAYDNKLVDSVRGSSGGIYYDLSSNSTSAESLPGAGVNGLNSTGFTIGGGTNNGYNGNGTTFVGWQWKESATAGFDIVTFTGGGAGTTINHSLGVAPKMIIVKDRQNAGSDWCVYTATTGAGSFLKLNTTAASAADTTMWANTSPTSSSFKWGYGSGVSYVAYLFAEVAGFSKFGSYTGNGSTDGPFVYCGFRPRWVMIKRTDSTDDWIVMDSSRNTYNVANSTLFPNGSYSETTDSNRQEDFLSNGFKVRSSPVYINANGGTYIYAAFAESPFKVALAR